MGARKINVLLDAQARVEAIAREMQRDIAELNSSLDDASIKAFSSSVDEVRRSIEAREALYSSLDDARRSAAALQALENHMKKAAPAMRALSLLVRVVPAAGELPASVGMKLVRAIAREFSQAHGAEGGTRRAIASQAKVRQYQTTWEDARARGRAKGAANTETAKAYGIKPGQVQRHRREARERGAPWRGEDESEA
jgi:hypothetical protein